MIQPQHLQKILGRKFPPIGDFVDIGGVYVHYYSSTPEGQINTDKPVIVMIHGLSGSIFDFYYSAFFAELRKQYKIVLVDRPGAGYSYIHSKKMMTLNQKSNIIYQLMAHLQIKQPVLLGHSLGGALVLNYACQYPAETKHLVLLAPLIYPVRAMNIPFLFLLQVSFIRTLVFGLIWCFQFLFFSALIKNAFRPNVECLLPEYQKATRDQLFSFKQFLSEFSNLLGLKNSLIQQQQAYAKLQMPISILVGSHDKILPAQNQAEQLKSEVPHLNLKILNRQGHMLNFSATAALINTIKNAADW